MLRWVVGILMVVALFWWALRPFVYWFTTQYVFTDHRIIVRTGLVARKGRDMPLSRVNDVSFEHSFVERFLNCGTLLVESAGTQGQMIIRSVWLSLRQGIRDALMFGILGEVLFVALELRRVVGLLSSLLEKQAFGSIGIEMEFGFLGRGRQRQQCGQQQVLEWSHGSLQKFVVI